MACPFPGMDPYLEDPAFWPDFHRSFITYLRDALFDRLPEAYEASIDETMRVIIPEELDTVHYPDVGITTSDDAGRGGSAGTAVALEPITIPAVTEEVRDVWLEVRHRPERSLVTVIEVLSPANKIGREATQFAVRRSRFLEVGVHVVELNFLLGGRRPEISSPWPAGEYYALVARAGSPAKAGVKSWRVLDPLLVIPIPLRSPDPDVVLDLAPVFATAYERGRYARRLRYASYPPAPMPDSAEVAVAELLQSHLARSGISR